jgi:hypothetical protein
MKRFKGALVVTLALVTGQLYAQPGDPAPAAAPGEPAAKSIGSMSAADMQASATTLEANVRVDLQHVTGLQARARTEKDVIKLSCINDKMIKLKAEANLFDQAKSQLLGVLDRDERFNTYPNLTQAADRVHKQREEADACVGRPELETDSGNSFTAPEIPDDPTLGLPFDDITVGGTMEPPGYASPYN